MKQQKTGGTIVFVASKNGLAASPNAAAYCTAKAAEIHLARCLALEGAEFGIRVNTVNPDAVLRGSKIWTGEWREQRAAAYNMRPGRAGGALPQALAAQAQRLPRRHRRGASLLRLRHVGEIDRQHRQCRRRQRAELYAVTAMTEQLIASRRRRKATTRRARPTSSATTPRSASGSTRRGIAIDAILDKVGAFHVAIPSWGVGTGGTRFARFPGQGEPRDIFDKIEDCAVIQQLTQATPTVSLHIPWDKADPNRLKQAASRFGLGFDAMNSNTFSDARDQKLSYKFGSLSHADAGTRRQAVEHNLECIEIGKTIGSKALTVWIGDGSNFPGPGQFHQGLRALSRMRCARSMLRCLTTGGCSPSTRCTSRPSIRRSCRTGAPTTSSPGSSAPRPIAWSTSATMRRTSISR